MQKLIYIALLFLLVASCTSKKESQQIENLYFGHRGSGANVYNNKYIENTLPSIENALDNLDGCEVDIQMSQDGTIWLYHDDMLGYFCDSLKENLFCIPNSSDSFIENLKQCREGLSDRVYKLDEVLEVLTKPKYKEKFLSLDVKGYFDSLCFPYRNAPDMYFLKIAKELVLMAESYDVADQIIVETGYTNFLDAVKESNKKIRCHLIGYKNFEEVASHALHKNYDGISFSLFDESITFQSLQEAKEKGLEVQVWPINDSSLLQKARVMKPFAMQISKLKFSDLLNSSVQE